MKVGYAVLLVLAFVGAVILFRVIEDYGAKMAIVKQRTDSLETALRSADSLQAKLRRRSAELAKADTAATVKLAQARRMFRSDSAKADSLRSLVDSLLHDRPDSDVFVRAIAAERAVGASCQRALGDCDLVVATLRAEKAVSDSIVGSLQPALDRTRAMWRDAEHRAAKRWRAGLCLAGGGVLGSDGVVRPGIAAGVCIAR